MHVRDTTYDPEEKRVLRSWLEGRSCQRVLAWFDARKAAGVSTDAAMERFGAEAVERDQLFLSLLGLA